VPFAVYLQLPWFRFEAEEPPNPFQHHSLLCHAASPMFRPADEANLLCPLLQAKHQQQQKMPQAPPSTLALRATCASRALSQASDSRATRHPTTTSAAAAGSHLQRSSMHPSGHLVGELDPAGQLAAAAATAGAGVEAEAEGCRMLQTAAAAAAGASPASYSM
jgi:hypothetical protein